MRAQPSCFGFEAPQADGLFFAVFPDATAAEQLERTAQQLCVRHRLASRPLPAARSHVSLIGFGEHSGLPTELVAGATQTAATIAAPPFEVTFDRAMSFGKPGRPRPLVLSGGGGVAPLIAFRRMLGEAIQSSGLGRVKSQYTPHVTLLYDEQGIDEHPVAPVRWTVRDVVLVHSVLGQSRYIPVGRWRLTG